MSDSAQILVAIDCPEYEAVKAGDAARDSLVEHGIVERELTDCVLGGDGRGHPPGPNVEVAVEGEADATRELWTNGLAVVVGRTVFDGGQNAIELLCPRCGATFEPGSEWLEAVDAWAAGDDDARYACPPCGLEQPLREWDGPWPWGFGYLGLEFWNWPPLKREFIDQLSSLVPGRLRLVHQHL